MTVPTAQAAGQNSAYRPPRWRLLPEIHDRAVVREVQPARGRVVEPPERGVVPGEIAASRSAFAPGPVQPFLARVDRLAGEQDAAATRVHEQRLVARRVARASRGSGCPAGRRRRRRSARRSPRGRPPIPAPCTRAGPPPRARRAGRRSGSRGCGGSGRRDPRGDGSSSRRRLPRRHVRGLPAHRSRAARPGGTGHPGRDARADARVEQEQATVPAARSRWAMTTPCSPGHGSSSGKVNDPASNGRTSQRSASPTGSPRYGGAV